MFNTKEEIAAWLEQERIDDYIINNDLTVDVEGSVHLSERNLKSLPVQFGVVEGWFDVSYNELTSLKGSPIRVDGHFECRQNKLTTLIGAPKEVGESFGCKVNLLTHLIGAPEKIGSDVFASFNLLTSLEGLPDTIYGCLDISHNKLDSVDSMPKKVVKEIFTAYNPIQINKALSFNLEFNIFSHYCEDKKEQIQLLNSFYVYQSSQNIYLLNIDSHTFNAEMEKFRVLQEKEVIESSLGKNNLKSHNQIKTKL